MNNTKLSYALHYQSQGLIPIPLFGVVDSVCSCAKGSTCESTGKHPRVKRATAIAATAENWKTWCAAWPEMNLGILTGSDTGVFVVDIDPRHNGDTSLKALFSIHGAFPATVTASTGGGGTHYLFQIPAGTTIRNSAGDEAGNAGIAPGLDVRGNGGLIVVEPSTTKGAYSWN